MSFDVSTHACQPAPARPRGSAPEDSPYDTAGNAPGPGHPASGVLTVRDRLAESVGDQLTDEFGPQGVLITGDAGSGKTTLLRAVADRLRISTLVIHLRGSTIGAHQPYGALRVQLADLPQNALNHPAGVINGLTRMLEDRAHGLPVIVIVDDANLLDANSTTVLGQMVQSGTIRLAAACRDLAEAPEYFQRLHREGALAPAELSRLAQRDVEAFLRSALGQPASRASSLALHRHSGGNIRLLVALLDDYLASGALRCVGGVGVLTTTEVRLGPRAARLMTERIDALLPSQRTLLTRLAAGPSPLGNIPTDSLGALDELLELGIVSIDRDRWATLSVASSLLSDVILGRPSQVQLWEAAGSAAGTVAKDSTPPRPDPVALTAEGFLNRAITATSDGQYSQVIKELQSDGFDPAALDPEKRRHAALLVCEALAFTGRVDDAKEAARAYQPWGDGGLPLSSRVAVSLAGLEAAAGNLFAMLDVSAQHLGRGSGTYEELAEGLIYAAGGRPSEAEGALLPALRQLQIHDPAGAAPLAAAGLAWINSTDDPERAEHYLSLASVTAPAASWGVRRLTRHFVALTLQGTVSGDRAALDFRDQAREDEALGNRTWQLIALCNAMRQGDHGVAPSVLLLSATCQGRYASLCQVYAKGVDSEDTELVLQAMDAALSLGDLLFARDAAASAVQLASQAADPATRGYVAERVSRIIGPPGTVLGARRQLASLTTRETEVVRGVVDGRTNRDLAQTLGVSVRTVEGHLHRVYAKLHIRTKAELLAKAALGAVTT
ncbi:LuxR C-terminal-related transcriptional regulator [Arthrobacter sp. CAN_A1]|uniref:LuxR C-terminal-related transcriptional regulator n=1 Tax=Arthrobacter sp. CAN_A1 TaxID=2787717 RepID=UPI0018C8FF44